MTFLCAGQKYLEPSAYLIAVNSTAYQPSWKKDIHPHAPRQNPFPEFEFLSKLTLVGDYCQVSKTASSAQTCRLENFEQFVLDESNEHVQRARAGCLSSQPGRPCNFFSQQAEDATLFNMFFNRIERGTYLEFGAVDGVLYSNTLFLEQNLGWSGVLLEASPSSFQGLQKNRAQRNHVFNLAICNAPGTKTFRGTNAEGGIEEFLPGKGKQASSTKYSVKCDTLKNVLRTANVTYIDFWSLDVEGGELDVLDSMDWSIPVCVLLVERNANDDAIELLLIEKGFLYVRQLRGIFF